NLLAKLRSFANRAVGYPAMEKRAGWAGRRENPSQENIFIRSIKQRPRGGAAVRRCHGDQKMSRARVGAVTPHRRVIIATLERTDLKRSRFASSKQARIWSAVRLANRPDLLLSTRCRQGRLRADTSRANLARKP